MQVAPIVEGRSTRGSDRLRRRASVRRQSAVNTRTETGQIEELLELGCYMGPGERYLMLYEGTLTITNRTGLAYWPRGNRRTIAIFDAAACAVGLTSRQWDEIFGRLRRIRGAVGANGAKAGDGHDCECSRIPEQVPQAHPT